MLLLLLSATMMSLLDLGVTSYPTTNHETANHQIYNSLQAVQLPRVALENLSSMVTSQYYFLETFLFPFVSCTIRVEELHIYLKFGHFTMTGTAPKPFRGGFFKPHYYFACLDGYQLNNSCREARSMPARKTFKEPNSDQPFRYRLDSNVPLVLHFPCGGLSTGDNKSYFLVLSVLLAKSYFNGSIYPK